MSNKLIKMVAAVSLAVMHAGAPAEDIDLFVAPPTKEGVPNVLFIVDNTANWGSGSNAQPFGNLKAALSNTLKGIPVNEFRVGILFSAETGQNDNNVSGGYVRAAIRLMDEENKKRYQALVDSLDSNNDKGNAGVSSLVMAEAYRYFSGGEPYAGNGKAKTDYVGNTCQECNQLTPANKELNAAVFGLPGNAIDSKDGIKYSAPETNNKCGLKNFIIYISNGPSQDNESALKAAAEMLVKENGDATQIPLSPSGSQGNISDEWARFMRQSPLGVVTYTIDVNPGTTGQGPGWTALLRSMSNASGGKYVAVKSSTGAGAQITDAINNALSEIQSVNSAFASASLPVSVNTQGTYLNQIFIGMFRPGKSPRWFGNLKQYQFRADTDGDGNVVGLTLADKDNVPAINPLNGFISPCARSFWSTAELYWPSAYLGSCVGSNERLDSPDGEIVEKGAVGQRLRFLGGISDRSVKTCTSCSALNPTIKDFDSGVASIADLGLPDDTDSSTHVSFVDWIRGQNVAEELGKDASSIRPSVHGDVVHSRPLAIDYGKEVGVVVFYGGNDGFLRAINGNPDVAGGSPYAGLSIADKVPGAELWSFVAPEHYKKFARLKNNSPAVFFPDATYDEKDPTPQRKDYFFDGPIGVYRKDDSVWIYPTMRRGGDSIYAFDVSKPAEPKLKWRRGSGELPNVGQTWSEPRVAMAKAHPSYDAATKSPIVIMGGGYDTCEDQDAAPNTACTLDGHKRVGNRVFVLDADTGELLQALGSGVDGDLIVASIAADVTAVDSDGDGYVDVAYAVDTAANVYRVDFGNAEAGKWKVKKIASLGCNTSADCSRKFLHAPEVVVGVDYHSVLVGSGNRERPLLKNAATEVDNGFFMIKDYHQSNSQGVITVDDLVAIKPDEALDDDQLKGLADESNRGWFLTLGSGSHDKEQVVTSAAVVAGVVYFSTHTPNDSECGAGLGLARGYTVTFTDASSPDGGARYSTFVGGGLPPSPVPGVVTLTLTAPDGSPMIGADGNPVKATIPFVIGGGGISGLDPTKVEVNPSGVRGRVYWYIEQ